MDRLVSDKNQDRGLSEGPLTNPLTSSITTNHHHNNHNNHRSNNNNNGGVVNNANSIDLEDFTTTDHGGYVRIEDTTDISRIPRIPGDGAQADETSLYCDSATTIIPSSGATTNNIKMRRKSDLTQTTTMTVSEAHQTRAAIAANNDKLNKINFEDFVIVEDNGEFV